MQQSLLINVPQAQGKRISDRCRYMDDDTQTRCILVDSIPVYLYDLADKTMERQLCVALYRSKIATQTDLANALGVTDRTVRYWVKNYRNNGAAGLVDKPRPGAPVKLTDEVKRKIKRYRRERMKVTEIAQIMNLSLGSVCEFLYSTKQKSPDLIEREDAPICDAAGEPFDSELAPAGVAGQVAESEDVTNNSDDEVARNQPCANQNVDPLNRSADRFAAIFGMIEDASPLFVVPRRVDRIEFAGGFLAIALLQSDPYLKVAGEVYKSFGAAFYGIRSTFMVLLLMALLRIKNCEKIEDYNPVKLGRLLGLDRSPCVKTLRCKMKELSLRKKASEFMERLAEERILQSDFPMATLYVDGHVKTYYGKFKIGKTHSSTLNKVVKGSTDYWLNLADGIPLICIQCQFNEAMTRMLPNILTDAKKIYSDRNPIIIFDRGGYSAELFEQLINDGYKIITYHKNGTKVDESVFQKGDIQINARNYEHLPYEQQIALQVYKDKRSKTGKSYRVPTGRSVTLREIRILREDRGQTAILTNLTIEEMAAIEVAENLFSRWTQENFLKYMIKQYDLDHLCSYGTESVDLTIDHPNPEYTKLSRQLREVSQKIGSILGKKAEELSGHDIKKAQKQLEKLKNSNTGVRLSSYLKTSKQIKLLLSTMPQRVTASDYGRLKPELKTLSNAIKISAYHIETKLVKILGNYYKGTKKNGRSIIAAALRSSGTIRINSKRLVVSLEKEATPQRTRFIQSLCQELNRRRAKYPSSNLNIYFEMTP
jgi:transposase